MLDLQEEMLYTIGQSDCMYGIVLSQRVCKGRRTDTIVHLLGGLDPIWPNEVVYHVYCITSVFNQTSLNKDQSKATNIIQLLISWVF